MDIPEDEANSAADTAQSLANDPAAREAAINQAEDKARAYADDPAKAIADAQAKADAEIAETKSAAEAAVKAKLTEAKQALEQYQNTIPDPAKAVADAQAKLAQAARDALEMAKQELVAVEAKVAQLEDLAKRGLTGPAAMAQAVADEIQGLVSIAVAACPLAGGASAAPSLPSGTAPAGAAIVELAAHEAAGGHLLRKHVGQTEAELAARLAAEPGIAAASSFFDKATAEAAISEALKANQAKIDDWMKTPSKKLLLAYTSPTPVGVSVLGGASDAVEASKVQAVLIKDATMPSGYRILTGYPVK